MSSPYARPDGRWRYNPPPTWPQPPASWTPPPRWEPDASWPPPPPGWAVWLPERSWPARHPGWTATAAVLVLLFVVGALAGDPQPADARPEPLAAAGTTSPSATPSPTASPTPSPTPSPTASPTSSPTPSPTPAAVTTRSVPAAPYYASCAAVRAAGKAPLRRGQPGYRPGLDGDADGIACEVATTRPRTVAPPPPPPAPEPPGGGDAYYANCSAARAAGAAPLYRGEPGYRSGLDRDGDGVACE